MVVMNSWPINKDPGQQPGHSVPNPGGRVSSDGASFLRGSRKPQVGQDSQVEEVDPRS